MTDAPANPDTGPSLVSIDLIQPIARGETTIDQLQLRQPKAGELRGLSLAAIMETDIDATLKLLPRISEPPLNAEDCAALHPADLAEIGGAIRGFFMTKAERAMMDALIAEQQAKT